MHTCTCTHKYTYTSHLVVSSRCHQHVTCNNIATLSHDATHLHHSQSSHQTATTSWSLWLVWAFHCMYVCMYLHIHTHGQINTYMYPYIYMIRTYVSIHACAYKLTVRWNRNGPYSFEMRPYDCLIHPLNTMCVYMCVCLYVCNANLCMCAEGCMFITRQAAATMYVCMHVYEYVCVCMRVCPRIRMTVPSDELLLLPSSTSTTLQVRDCPSTYTYIHVCMYAFVCTWITNRQTYAYIRVYMHMHVC